jgi:cytochrome c-type biogenesis protein CcmH/NrfG
VLDPVATAAEAYQRAQSALRDDNVSVAIEELFKATELVPTDVDYQAMLAWAQFCNAVDKVKMAEKTRKVLGHAIQKSAKPELSRFYPGRMERMLGRDREALRHFQEVLEVQPRHAEAASEVRLLETRIASGSGEKPGLASLFGRKKP